MNGDAPRQVRIAHRRRRGIVLIVVSIVVALVSLSALGLLVAMQSENRMAHLQADQQQVAQVAASGISLLQEFSALPRADRQAWGGLQDNVTLFRDIRVDLDPFGARHGRFAMLAPQYVETQPKPTFRFGVNDASAKLSLEALLIWDQRYPGSARLALMHLPGMTEAVADSILDWVDADDEPREFGAESEFYQGLDPPRTPPNMLPMRLEELLAVRGVNAYQLLGEQDGMQQVVDPLQSGASAVNSPLAEPAMMPMDLATQPAGTSSFTITPAPPWAHYLTLFSAERNVSHSGTPRIQLNQESLSELHGQLTNAFDREIADFVVAYRQLGPAGGDVQDAEDTMPAIDLSEEASYEISSPIELLDSVVAVQVPGGSDSEEARTRRIAGPFQSRNTEAMQNFIKFCDRVATNSETRIAGRVNIMVAPRPVLLGVPGLTPDQVDQILNARDEVRSSNEPDTRLHAAWLVADDVVDRETLMNIEPFVTVAGDVFEAQIVACYDAQSPWARCEIIVDGTMPGAPAVYYRDLRRLGRGFAWSVLVSPPELETTPGATASPSEARISQSLTGPTLNPLP